VKNWPFISVSCDLPDKQPNLFDIIWTVLGNLKERDGLKDSGINGKITLKQNNRRSWIGTIWLRIGI
jgi:hypothetical protein